MSGPSKIPQEEIDKLDENYRHYRNQIIQLTSTIIIISSVILGWVVSRTDEGLASHYPTWVLALISLAALLIIIATVMGMISQYLVFRGYFESAQFKFKRLMEKHYPNGRNDIKDHQKAANKFFGKADTLTHICFSVFIPSFALITLLVLGNILFSK